MKDKVRKIFVSTITVFAGIILLACMVGFDDSFWVACPMFLSVAWLFMFGFANSEEWRNQ